MSNITGLQVFSLLSVLFFFLPLVSGCSSAPSNDDNSLPVERFQAVLNKAVSEGGTPGAVLGVDTPRGRWIGVAGQADIDTGEEMTAGVQFRTASITKEFTAALVMKLYEEGEISLDDTVEKWLPGVLPNCDKITVHNLLNHTSGIYDYFISPDFWSELKKDPEKEWQESEVVSIFAGHEPVFEPGTSWGYSNSNYFLLGMIIEKVTGNKVEDEFKNRIAAPLNLNRTRLTKSGYLDGINTPGYGLIFEGTQLESTGSWNFSWDWTSGSVVSSAGDLIEWMKALASGKVVKEETYQMMFTPIPPSPGYGYGLLHQDAETSLYGMETILHSGGDPGTSAMLIYLPGIKTTIFYMINRMDVSSDGKLSMPEGFNMIGNEMVEIFGK